ncbi:MULTISPECIES: hypothetical protein [Chryseobacterium]|uniref:hypothetical protein n=1 Tax=Chryseobacterium TaxID=59732 RepID=UPI0012964D7A|nr:MULTISPECIES: hypothetical protein [Chryseobacterium]MDR6921525.1 hypothetical protein [Chryseobacterium sp. 2987]
MKSKKGPSIIFIILAIIIGSALYKQFDIENLKFKSTGLAILYFVTLIFCVYILIKDYINKPKE